MTDAVVLDSGAGLRARILGHGATLGSLEVAGRSIALGYSEADQYRDSPHFVGACIGRYANRLADARIEVDGVKYQLAANDGPHHLHGGPAGWHTRTWTFVESSPMLVRLALMSPNGDGGYPGAVSASVAYQVSGTSLSVTLEATTDALTELNLTHHAYLNLDGAGTVAGHRLQVWAETFTPTDADGLTLGEFRPLDGLALDLRESQPLGQMLEDVAASGDVAVAGRGGLDHNYVVNRAGDSMQSRRVAQLTSSSDDLVADLYSDQPGLQVYTGNGFDDRPGVPLRQVRHAGVALEPQAHPGTAHHPELGCTLLGPGETYRNTFTWVFSGLGC